MGLRASGLGFQVKFLTTFNGVPSWLGSGWGRVWGSGCRLQCAGLRVQGAGIRVLGSKFRVQG